MKLSFFYKIFFLLNLYIDKKKKIQKKMSKNCNFVNTFLAFSTHQREKRVRQAMLLIFCCKEKTKLKKSTAVYKTEKNNLFSFIAIIVSKSTTKRKKMSKSLNVFLLFFVFSNFVIYKHLFLFLLSSTLL